jgi:hypothetical protein
VSPPQSILPRLLNSPAAWSWILNLLRLGTGLLLLPLLLINLSVDELGIHYVFNNLLLLLPAFDSTLSFNLVRFASYTWGGARELLPLGLQSVPGDGQPNRALLWDLVRASKRLYRCLAVTVILLGLICGWFILRDQLSTLNSPGVVWAALVLTAMAMGSELYWGRWNCFLKGQNEMLLSLRLQCLGYGLRVILATVLLVSGAGLLSIPVAALMSGTVQRLLARAACLRRLGEEKSQSVGYNTREIVKLMLPSAWRIAMQLSSQFLLVNSLSFLCVRFFGLETQASYGLSLQLLGIVTALSSVWFSTQVPKLNSLRLQNKSSEMLLILRPCLLRQALTFVLLAIPAITLGSAFVAWLDPDKSLLPVGLLLLLALHAFMEMQFNLWTITAATENLIPSAWPATITNCCATLLAGALIFSTNTGVAGLVIAPMVTGIFFNYWYWPWKIPRTLGTSFFRLMSGKSQTRT